MLRQRGSDATVISATERWLNSFVIEFNLCPFAQPALKRRGVRFAVRRGNDSDSHLRALVQELRWLESNSTVETTLLILPEATRDFLAFNAFLALADDGLVSAGVEGVFQLASFHPHYQFAGTQVDDAENFTNRSPFPMLHILRESSVAWAIDTHPDIHAIPQTNVTRMNELGNTVLTKRLDQCTDPTRTDA